MAALAELAADQETLDNPWGQLNACRLLLFLPLPVFSILQFPYAQPEHLILPFSCTGCGCCRHSLCCVFPLSPGQSRVIPCDVLRIIPRHSWRPLLLEPLRLPPQPATIQRWIHLSPPCCSSFLYPPFPYLRSPFRSILVSYFPSYASLSSPNSKLHSSHPRSPFRRTVGYFFLSRIWPSRFSSFGELFFVCAGPMSPFESACERACCESSSLSAFRSTGSCETGQSLRMRALLRQTRSACRGDLHPECIHSST